MIERLPERVLAGLRAAAPAVLAAMAGARPLAMADQGLAHHHLRLPGSGLLARVPKHSQMGLGPAVNLRYQAACFERAAPCGHTPRLAGVLPPSPDLPQGALLVEEISGRPVRLADDLPALLHALARLHALALPPADRRAPLLRAADPTARLRREIDAQAVHLADRRIPAASRERIQAVRRAWRAPRGAERRLIAFDAHPGNFIVRPSGQAVLVDLEKARYSLPALDVAHATLYTSTTWDTRSHAVLSPGEVAQAYLLWRRELGRGARHARGLAGTAPGNVAVVRHLVRELAGDPGPRPARAAARCAGTCANACGTTWRLTPWQRWPTASTNSAACCPAERSWLRPCKSGDRPGPALSATLGRPCFRWFWRSSCRVAFPPQQSPLLPCPPSPSSSALARR